MPIQKGAALPNVALQSLTTAGAANTTTPLTCTVSKDGGVPAAATNSATSVASGHWKIDLTAAEMNANVVTVVAVGSGLMPFQVTFYPEGAFTASRAAALDNLDAAISTRSTYAGADTPGTSTLLGRLTANRATALDNLDATVSSRLASSAYVAPPSASTVGAAVWADTTGASNTTKINALDAAVTGSQTTGAVADGTGTTTAFTLSGLSQSKSYIGMQVEFTGGANDNTRRQITEQANSGGNVRLTVGTAFGAAPASGDTATVF